MSKLRRPPDSRTVLIGALILLNLMVLGGAVKVLLDGRRFLATAAEARGVVVDVAKVREYDSDAGAGRSVTRLYPVVEFVTAREQVVRYQPPKGSNPPDYRVGGPLRSSTTRPTPSTSSSTPGTSCGRRASSLLPWGSC